MEVVIHRGTSEIGGTCIELINSKNKSILIDMGTPLNEEAQEKNVSELAPTSLDFSNNRCLGVLISHAHQDHFGLIEIADSHNIPIYANEVSKRIIDVSSFWIPNRYNIQDIHTFVLECSFFIEDFKITSYKVDHTFDAVAFLIEVDNKKIFYTGDFRAHGNINYFKQLLQKKALYHTDCMLIEGTTVGNSSSHSAKPETALIDEFVDFFKDCNALGMIACSSQNFDRIVNIIKAKNKLNKTLVIDAYTYDILRAYGNEKLNGALTQAKVFMPHNQRIKIKESAQFEKLCPSYQRVYKEDFQKNYKNYILLYKSSHKRLFSEIPECLLGARLAFSMWSVYFQRDEQLQAFIQKNNITCKHIHTSGHADPKSISTLIKTLKPNVIIPVHTENPQWFKDNFANCLLLDDGQKHSFEQRCIMSKIIRGISPSFAEKFINSYCYKLYKEQRQDLFLAIRNNYINIYYKSKNIARVSEKRKDGTHKLVCEIHVKYLQNETKEQKYQTVDSKYIYENFISIKTIIDNHFSTSQEKLAQQKLILNNNSNPNAKYFCIDMEYVKQRNCGKETAFGRFDIIAISKKKPHQVALIELKYGNNALGGTSGVLKHTADYINFTQENIFEKHLKAELINIIKSYALLNIETPFTSIGGSTHFQIQESDLCNEPTIYFISLDNVHDKVRKTMQKYFLNNVQGASKYNVESELGINVTTHNNENFKPRFLFSDDDGSNIHDIIEDTLYNKKTLI